MDLGRRGPHEAALRGELIRLEKSHPLSSSPKLLQLLRYLFKETLAGRGQQISQYSIAFDCLDLGDQFDSAANTVVRSHARRLRRILAELKPEQGAARILMRERGYQLAFEVAAQSFPNAELTEKIRPPALGVVEFEPMSGVEAPGHLVRRLAAELMVELANTDGVEAIGPFPRTMLAGPGSCARELAHSHGLDMVLDGSFFIEDGQCRIHPKILDGKSGRQLWAVRHGIPTEDVSPGAIRALARVLAAKVAGDWGVVPNHIAKLARSCPDEPLRLHEALVLGRQYLTNFHFEHLGRCVETLRQRAMDSEDAAVPATLAVLLNAAGTVEPRWHEKLARREIGELAACASRLDPEDPWTRLAVAIAAMLDGRFGVVLEMARRVDHESGSSLMLSGALGSMLCFQNIDVDLGRRMLDRYCRKSASYPRLVHLSLALLAVAENDPATARAELARFGVPWGWSFPLVAAACAAIEGDEETARAEWQRVLTAHPDFQNCWRETIATQWSEGYLHHIFRVLENAGVRTGCL